jgi:hypothetical protein
MFLIMPDTATNHEFHGVNLIPLFALYKVIYEASEGSMSVWLWQPVTLYRPRASNG